MRGIAYLRNLLNQKQSRVNLRYRYYEMKNSVRDFTLINNSKIRSLRPTLGWCTKAVDALADRLTLKGWKDDQFNLTAIFNTNNPDVFFDSAITSALICGCSFVYVSKDEEGFPRLDVIDGRFATGVVDPGTNLLKEGYAILETDSSGNPALEAYFIPGATVFFPKNEDPYTIENSCPYPLLVPIIYKPDSKRPFGHSRITRANMSIEDSAVRTMKRSEISAEFYSFPQKYVTGLSEEAEKVMDTWKATVTSMLRFSKDDEGEKPTLGQFQQASMSPFTEQLRTFAALFAGENGLTLDDLGFVSENPSSAEAIKASHETLRLTARKAQRMFGSGFLNVGYVAACLRDDTAYLRSQVVLTKPVWEPIFEPDAAMLSSIGDGAIKLNQAVPGYFNKDNLGELTGIEPSELQVQEPADGE